MGRREVVRQSDFGFGELSETYAASNAEAKTKSLKRGTNVRILNSYGYGQRYGSRRMATASGSGIVIEMITSEGASLLGVVRAAGVDIYTQDGSLIQSVGGAPWSAAEAASLTWHSREDTVYFTIHGYWPRVLSRTGGAWGLSLFAFDSGAGGSILQPYYRFARSGITMTPSALTGSINIVFSDDVLVANHVGVRFRYGATATSLKEMLITSVADARNGVATVVDKLPPSFDVTVADGSGFRIGESVEGRDSSATGVATNVAGNVLTVLMEDGYSSFTVAEVLVGPFSSSAISAVSASASPSGSTVWDEAVLSPVHGYPGDVFERSGRLGFADIPDIPGAVILSAPGARNDFDVGKGEAQDGIFWLLAEGGQRVLYCVSASSLIILTDRHAYYVPEDQNTPLAANTFVPIEVGPTGASYAFPITVEEGIVYIEKGGNRVMGLLQTGNLSAPFELTDLSKHAAHLIKNPVSLSLTNGNAQAPERYIFALNADGSLTCMFFDTNPPRLGLTPWQTTGAYLAMVPINGIIYGLCRRVINGATVHFLERFDATVQMDASSLFSSAGSYLTLTDDAEESITDDFGRPLQTDVAAMPHLAGTMVSVIRGNELLGNFTVGADGSIPGITSEDGDFEAGLHFEIDSVLWPPEAQDDQRTMFARRRIVHAAVRVDNSGVYTVGLLDSAQVNTRPAYDQGDDLEAAPPLRSEVKRFPLSGYQHEPCVQIKRPLPQALTVLSVAQEVNITW
jgi:hypothetical protein